MKPTPQAEGAARFFASRVTGIFYLLCGSTLFLCGNVLPPAAGQTPLPSPSPVPAPVLSTPPPQAITFLVPRQRLWLGHSQVIAFQAPPTHQKQVFPATVEPAAAVDMLQAPTQLEGETIGYLRVRALQGGPATLHMGNLSLPLDIVADDADRDSTRYNPQIISPQSGSYVWGKIGVGVELPVYSPEAWKTDVQLRLPNGDVLKPLATLDSGAHRHFSFAMDADALPPGNAKLEAISLDGSGHTTTSDPVYLVVTRPDPSLMIAGACADHLDGPRPQRLGEQPPSIIKDPKLPEGAYVNNTNANPAWCLPIEIKESGRYQMALRARGDFGGGTYPSVGLVLDDQDRPLTSTRLTGSDWQRIPLGKPVFLEAGSHVITARYLNDFKFSKDSKRDLFLARYEIVRVDSTPEEADALMDPTPAMQDDALQMMDPPRNPELVSPVDASQPGSQPLLVAFQKVFDGQTIAGTVTINATAWWQDHDQPGVPHVELWINAKRVQSQQGSELLFRVPIPAFHPGENVVQLRARLRGGLTAVSPAQRLILPKVEISSEPPARFLRYTSLDSAWDPSMAQRLEKTPNPTGAFLSNGESFLSLPANLTGTFHIRLEARGQEFQGPPIAEVLLQTPGNKEHSLIQVPIHNGFQTVDAANVTLESGPKQLVVRYINDLMEAPDPEKKTAGGDRNLWIKAVRLEEISRDSSLDTEPMIAIRYPQDQQVVGSADAVVADVFSGKDLAWADLVIDNQPQQLQLRPDSGIGPVLFPLLTRSLVPGTHTLRVITQDYQKHQTGSRVLNFTVAPPGQVVNGPYPRALYLLNRFAYGPEPSQLAAILTLGEKKWLQQELNETFQAPAEQTVVNTLKTLYPDDRNEGLVVPRTLQYLLATANPVRARFLMWTENHFSTWIQKDGPANKWKEHEQFAKLGLAPFADLLMASATSPAMLVYLDQQKSYANRLNENYAREIMELHTLGVHGGYTQTDVTTLAQELNGWTLSEEADLNGNTYNLQRVFRFDPALNNGKPRRILGMEFPAVPPEKRYDSTLSALEMLAAHPSTAQFISRKLAEDYVSDPASPQLVDDLTQLYLETGGDMRAMLTAISEHPDFWNAQTKVATPLDFSLRFSRVCGAVNPGAVNDFLRRSAMGLFDRATPDGYPSADNNYADSNALLQRWHFSRNFQGNLNRLIPPAWIPAPNAPLTRDQAQHMVDLAAVRMTGEPLSPASNDAVIDYLVGASTTEPDRVKLVTDIISQTPEISLR